MNRNTSWLQHPRINQWSLYWLVAGCQAISMLYLMMLRDLGSAEGVSAMIQSSVRWSVPWLFLAFGASSLQALLPGNTARWLLRNRRIIGLCFATGMAWQVSFIIWLVTVHTDYYVNEVYVLRDVIEGLLGYLFVILMTITSFQRGRKLLTPRPKQWKWLHMTGIYFLWAYAFSTYWYAVFYYDNPDSLHYFFYVMGAAALSVRIAAWVKKQQAALDRAATPEVYLPGLRLAGRLAILLGVIGAASGSLWTGLAHEHMYGVGWAQFLELYVPYWPFIPYLPMFALALGAYLIVSARRIPGD
jgi:hypothetical protein